MRSTTSPAPTCIPSFTPSTPAIDPPWEARSDWDTFKDLALVFSRLAANTSACATTSWPPRWHTTHRPSIAAPGRRQGLARRRSRAHPRQDDAQPDRGRPRLRRHLRQAREPRSAGRVGRHRIEGRELASLTPRWPGWPALTAPPIAAWLPAVLPSSAPSRSPRRCWRSPARPTARWPTGALRSSSGALASRWPTLPLASATPTCAGPTFRRDRRRP